ncbi:hypothetical protein AB0J83_48380 [Actinoplanes sp. NPDC049596]|uniref:effector-associated constant component EACC1 n=1 Tax=unclassified Actinoplanes TaxID=2626549 RepID=UPI00341242D3
MEPISLTVLSPHHDRQILSQNLREALLRTGVDDVRPASAGAAPPGTRSGEALAIGALVVTLAPTVVETLMTVLASWLSRQPAEVEIDIDGRRFRGPVTRAQRDALVAHYLRHTDPEP